MKTEFVAIDVETANADMSSICQIGLARFQGDKLVQEWKTYIDPEDYFSSLNTGIHGIDESTVKGSPTFRAIANNLFQFIGSRVVVCHTHFDRVAINQAAKKCGIQPPNFKWLDSARIARRTWDQFAYSGYGLKNIADNLGYNFQHHDALEDAKAAGFIVLQAINQSGLDIDGWLIRVEQPIDPNNVSSSSIKREGNPEGELFGEVLVFTGALTIPRKEAADLAAKVGCHIASGVTKKTTMLVVGDQDIRRLAGHKKSSKHRKAEQLIQKGQSIRILKETDFVELVSIIK